MSFWAAKKQQLQHFYFKEEIPYGFALMRILLCAVLLQAVVARWPFCLELYSTIGTPNSIMESFGYPNYLPPMPPFWTGCCFSMLVVFLFCACIGFCTRIALVGVLIFHTYFAINDLTSSITKFTVISTHALLLMLLADCGRIWSVDSWLASRRDPLRVWNSERPAWALSPVWTRQLLQLMVGYVYLGAAITKIHMPEFVSGEAMAYWILSNPNYRSFIGEYLSTSPSMLVASAYFTILWEAIFLFISWQGIPRYIAFGMGVLFHGMAAFTLGEVTFLMIISTIYVGCLTEAEVLFCRRLVGHLLSPVTSRLRIPNLNFASWIPARVTQFTPRILTTAFLVSVCLFGTASGWSIANSDPFGERRPEGKHPLRVLPDEEVQHLFAKFEPIREEDKFLAVDVGSVLIGDRLADRRRNFHYQDVLICETSFNPPHGDMYVECNLVGTDNKPINKLGVIVPREHSYAHFRYQLTDALVPGNYYLVVKSGNREICRREFFVEREQMAQAAN